MTTWKRAGLYADCVEDEMTDQNMILSKALEAGFMISTAHGQSKDKLMPVSDVDTLMKFSALLQPTPAKCLTCGARPGEDLNDMPQETSSTSLDSAIDFAEAALAKPAYPMNALIGCEHIRALIQAAQENQTLRDERYRLANSNIELRAEIERLKQGGV